jgi:putative SOS response-associated peptidase YedK
MCGRYISVQKKENLEKIFEAKFAENAQYKANYNISVGDFAPIITNLNPYEIQMFRFGLNPAWVEKPRYIFNVRAEGENNPSNEIDYMGIKGIMSNPNCNKPLRSQRCLVIADAYIESSLQFGFKKPYVVYLKENRRPLAFAGIWDTWLNKESGEEVNSFSIVTVPANELVRRIPNDRMPVILPRGKEKVWLDTGKNMSDILRLLRTYPAYMMNAYPVTEQYKSTEVNGSWLLEPKGRRLDSDFGAKIYESEPSQAIRMYA